MPLYRFISLMLWAVVTRSVFAAPPSSDVQNISDSINTLFSHGEKHLGIPSDPRTVIKLEEKVSRPVKVTIGLQTQIFGAVEANLKTEVEWDKDFSVTTWIFVEGENADIIRQNPEGTYYFDPGNRRAVRLCAVSASYTLDSSYSGKVFLGVQGIEKTKKYSGVEQVLQSSEIVEVKPGESPNFHKKACDAFAQKKAPEVKKTLDAMAASRIYWDNLSQCNPTEPITPESTCGQWHRTLIPSVTAWTEPVCARRPGGKNYFCTIRSIKGGSCPYRDPITKKLLTSGMFEYPCAKGLFCELKKPAQWFKYGEAECSPIREDQGISRSTQRTAHTTH